MKAKIGWWGPSCTGLGQGLMVIFLHKRATKIVQMDFIWRGSGYCSDRQTMDLFPLIRWVPHTQPPTGRALQFPSMTDSHRKQMTDKNHESNRKKLGHPMGDSYQDVGEDNFDKWRSREGDWQGRWGLHFQRDKTACYLNLVVLKISSFVYSKRRKRERRHIKCKKRKVMWQEDTKKARKKRGQEWHSQINQKKTTLWSDTHINT